MIEKVIAKFGVYIVAIGGFIGLLLGAFLKGKKAARQEVKADTVDKIIEVTKKDKEIEKTIDDTPIGRIRAGLRKNASDAE